MVAILYFQLLHLLVEAEHQAEPQDPQGVVAVAVAAFPGHLSAAAELPGREMLVVR
jgi:hypothetical protein